MSFLDSGILTLEYAVSYERLVEGTRIVGAQPSRSASTTSARSRPAISRTWAGRSAAEVSITRGGFFDGERTSVGGSVTLRPSARLFVEGTAQRNRLTLAGRTFDADLFGGRVRIARDTRTFLSAFVQYNESDDELQTNIRFNLIHAPLSDLFLVYSERQEPELRESGEAGLIDRAITVKFTKLLAF